MLTKQLTESLEYLSELSFHHARESMSGSALSRIKAVISDSALSSESSSKRKSSTHCTFALTKKDDMYMLLKENEWETMAKISKVLQQLTKVTTYMSTESNVSTSVVYPIVCGLIRKHLACFAFFGKFSFSLDLRFNIVKGS
jgi:hypothetical protein